MQSQADPAGRTFRSPAFAALYSQRLQELRGRLAHVCRQAWDVNALWLIRHDMAGLVRQIDRQEPGTDVSAWNALCTRLDTALEQTALPDAETREEVLALFRRIDIAAPVPEQRHAAVRQSENERIEIPPPAFWRRWCDDAPAPTYTLPEVASASASPEAGFDLEHIDIDAIIAAGHVGRSSLDVVQERIATQVVEPATPVPTPPRKADDDFLETGTTRPGVDGDYDWDLGDPANASRDQSLEAFWEVTATPASAPPPPVTPVVPAAPPAPVQPAASAPVAHSHTAPSPPAAPTARQAAVPLAPAATPSRPSAPAPTPVAAIVKPAPAPTAHSPSAPPVTPPRPPAPTPAPVAAAPRPAPAPASAQSTPAPAAPAAPARPTPPPPRPAPAPAPAATRPALSSGAGLRIYHLTESDDLACELDQRLEQLEYELELLESAEELTEVLGALTPNLVIVDAQFKDSLESIGTVLRVARQRSSDPIRLLVLGYSDTMDLRLAARRAGADSVLIDARDSDTVIARVEEVLHGTKDDRYRVMVVEDDRAQGLFAESILRNAGMEVELVEDGLKVMEALRRFRPDLVLMDLHMPNCDGAELTALIREHDEFINTPIVFLSGESDQDKHYEALSAGGDDFLSKPIRPKYLIATVNNRIRRARAILQRNAQSTQPEPFDSGTGLHFRAAMLERLEQALVQIQPEQRSGGLLFIAIEDVPALRQRLGLTSVEELLEDVAQFIVTHMGAGTMASRYGDACFLIFDAHADPEQLRINAEQIRDALAFHPFETPREILSLRASVGIADLRQPFADAAAVIFSAEQDAHPPTIAATVPAPAQPAASMPVVAQRPADTDRVQEITALLADAIVRDTLDLDFQPIAALAESGRAQYQTLLRLRRPGQTDIKARELLPILRAQERLPEFDRWVLRRALDVATNRSAIARPVTLFVSQAIETLCQPGFSAWLAEQFHALGRVGSSLVIEINADEVGLELATIQAVIADLLPHGVRFCLSRYSGSEDQEGILTVVPVDLVKIAPDLIAHLGSSEQRAAFSVLVEQLHERTIAVIAPRVEETRTAAVLWMSGVDYIQGNLVQLAGHSLDFDFNAAVL